MNIKEQVLSREQMARLRELGVDTSDASMAYYNISRDNQPDKWILGIANIKVASVMLSNGITEMEPTYTIGDLINKLPPEINDSVLMIFADAKTVSYTSWAAYSLDSDMVAFDYNGSTLMKALHGLLCWVAENYKELIK